MNFFVPAIISNVSSLMSLAIKIFCFIIEATFSFISFSLIFTFKISQQGLQKNWEDTQCFQTQHFYKFITISALHKTLISLLTPSQLRTISFIWGGAILSKKMRPSKRIFLSFSSYCFSMGLHKNWVFLANVKTLLT